MSSGTVIDRLAASQVDLDSLRLGDLGIDISKLGWQQTEDDTMEIVHTQDKYAMDQEEEGWLNRVLDSCKRIHATGVVRLYTCAKTESEWKYVGLWGVAAVVTEADLRMACAHFIRIIDLDGFNPNSSTILQQEIYPNFQYTVQNSFFHTFEMNKYIAGLSFANETHAKEFKEKVENCLKVSAVDVVDEEVDSKEKSYKIVGDTGWRTADETLSVNVARKYAAGGITDGVEVNWKKKGNLPEELKNLLSQAGALEEEANEPIVDDPHSDKINLVSEKRARRLTVQAQVQEDGNVTIGDGIGFSWAKNKKSLTESKLPLPVVSPPTAKKKRFGVFSSKKKKT